jgi:hypothetical protein
LSSVPSAACSLSSPCPWFSSICSELKTEGSSKSQHKPLAKRKNKSPQIKGIIDKADYIVEEDNEMADLIDTLTKEDESALELKFYPIIPNVINVLCNEFSKRSSRIMFKAMDDISHNEMMEEKRGMVEKVLLARIS